MWGLYSVLFLYVFLTPIARANPLAIVAPVTNAANAPAELQDFFSRIGQRPLDPSARPEFARALESLAQMTRGLLLAKDGTNKIYFTILDSMDPSAFFTQLPNGEKVIGVSLGLLRALNSDDEIAFVIGHELSHGASSLQNYIDSRRGKESGLYLGSLQRSVENEVDVLSVVERLHRNGFNQHAGYRALRNIARGGPSLSHTTNASRFDTLGIATTALSRRYGERLKPDIDSAYGRQVIGPLQDQFLRTDSFRELQLRRARALLQNVPNSAVEVYTAVRDRTDLPGTLRADYAFSAEVHDVQKELDRLLIGLITPEESLDFAIDLIERMDQAYSSAAREVLGPNFSPSSIQQLVDLVQLARRDSHNIRNRVHSFPSAMRNYVELEQKIAGLEAKAANGQDESRLVKLRRDLADARRELELSRYLYGDTEWTRAVEVASRADLNGSMAAHSVWRALQDQDTLMYGEYGQARRFGVIGERGDRESLAILQNFAEPVLSSSAMEDAKGRFALLELPAPEGLDGRYTEQVLSRFARDRRDALTRARSPEELRSVMQGTYAQLHEVRFLLERVDKKNRESVINFFQELVRDAIQFCQGESCLEIFAGISSHRYSEMHPFSIEGGRLSLNSAFTRRIFSQEMLRDFARKNLEAFSASLDSGGNFLERIPLVERGLQPIFDLAGFSLLDDETLQRLSLARRAVIDRLNRELNEIAGAAVPRSDADALLRSLMPNWSTDLAPEEISRSLRALHANPKLRERFSGALSITDVYKAIRQALDPFETLYQIQYWLAPLADDDDYRLLSVAEPFQRWLAIHHPEELAWRRRLFLPGVQFTESREEDRGWGFAADRERFVKDRLNFHLMQQSSSLPLEQRYALATQAFHEEFSDWGRNGSTRHWTDYHEIFGRWLYPSVASVEERARALIGYMDGLERFLGNGGSSDAKLHRFSRTWLSYMGLSPEIMRHLSPETAVALARTVLKHWPVSKENDAIFEAVWALTEGRPNLRARLADSSLVNKLYFDENKTKLARYLINEEFGVDNYFRVHRRGGGSTHPNGQIRTEVRGAMARIEAMLPNASPLRDDLLGHLETSLITNSSETELIAALKIIRQREQIITSRNLAALDSPHILSTALRSNFDRMSVIDYMIGASNELNLDFGGVRDSVIESAIRQMPAARRAFAESDEVIRNYVIQALLGAENGVLDEPRVYERLVRRTLGDLADHPVLRAIFDAYMESLPESEKRVVLAHILGSFSGSRMQRPSVAVIFRAMGPFGIVAAQNLRTSDLLSGSLRDELDEFFDRALPPSRTDVFQQLRRIFGDQIVGDENSIREVLGSGSKNYVVLAELRDPSTGRSRRVVIRLQREHLSGLIENENRIWEEAIGRLTQNSNPEVVRTGRILEEVRASTMTDLGPGGQELDLSVERGKVGEAREAYARPARGAGDFSVHVIAPDEELQALVPEAYSSVASVYEFVDSTALDELPVERRQKAAASIVEAELRALFELGHFDPDGHPGNWLIDLQNSRLVRIDYAQLTRLTDAQRIAMRDSFATLLYPHIRGAGVDILAENFREVFNIERSLPDINIKATIAEIIAESSFPGAEAPHLRLYYLRDRLEARLGLPVRIQPGMRAALASLARTGVYRKHLAPGQYADLLLANFSSRDQIGLRSAHLRQRAGNWLQAPRIRAAISGFFRGVASRATASAPDSQASGMAKCLRFFRALGSRR